MKISSVLKKGILVFSLVPFISFLHAYSPDSTLIARGGEERENQFHQPNRNQSMYHNNQQIQHPAAAEDAAMQHGYNQGMEQGSNQGGTTVVIPNSSGQPQANPNANPAYPSPGSPP